MSFKQKLAQIDLFGAFLLICGIVCLLLALQWGGSTYPWHNSKVWGCILGFGLIIVCFIAWQFKLGDRYLLPVVESLFRITDWLQRATIPPRIISQRTIASSAAFSSFLAMGVYA